MKLPKYWNNTSIGEIAHKIGSGVTPKGGRETYLSCGVPIIRSQNVLWGSLDLEDVARISIDQHKKMKGSVVFQNDLLLNITGASIGRCCVVPDGTEEANVNQHVCIIRLNDDAYPVFVMNCLISPLGQNQIDLFQAGGNRQGLNFQQIAAIKIPLPPLPEQKAIADLLSTWDKAIEKTEKLIATKEKNLKRAIGETFSDKATKNKGWKIVQLGEVFAEVTEKVGSKDLAPHSISAGIGFVSHQEKWGKDISGEQYQNYTHLKAGEFAYNKGNSKRYKQGCAYLLKEGEICVPNVFICFKPRNESVVVDFYAHYFIADYHAKELKKYISSGARADGLLNLNKSDFFQILVPFPSKKEQSELANTFDTFQTEIEILKSLAGKYKEQKRGLMQKLLTGEWRVKVA